MTSWCRTRDREILTSERLPLALAQSSVEQVQIRHFIRAPSFRGSQISPAASELTREAREAHAKCGFGFWDFVLRGTPDADTTTRAGIYAGALSHQQDRWPITTITVEELRTAMQEGKYSALPPREVVSLTSFVVLANRSQAHLVLLDFAYPSSVAGDRTAIEIVQALDLVGDLYDSGRSYHFVGATPVATSELISTLGRAALLSPLIDGRWVAHQLAQGYCSLRISHDTQRHPQPPRLIATSQPI